MTRIAALIAAVVIYTATASPVLALAARVMA